MLVDVIQRKLMGHCLQDLVCAKCKEVNLRRGIIGISVDPIPHINLVQV